MNVLIIEDEYLTAERIRSMLRGIDQGIVVMAMLDSVKSSVQWFRDHEKPDLVLMDIQLADGLSFEIFEQVRVDVPVIFLTAYQEYAIKAFKVNSVDYLIKPVKEKDIRSSLEKYRRYFTREQSPTIIDTGLLKSIQQMISKPYKSRFMVRVGDRIRSVDVESILYFYSLQKGTYLHTDDNRNYAIDYTLEALAEMVDPALFHRINRRYIIAHGAIRDMITLSGSRLKVVLHQSEDQDIYISRERLAAFKEWIDQ
jgi:two-component system LytT family response regulator